MRAAEMAHGTGVYGYKIVRRTYEEHNVVRHTVGSNIEVATGARSFLYLGGAVADDEEVIDFATCTKMRNYDGQPLWMQEPGGQALSDEQVDEIIASGATVRKP